MLLSRPLAALTLARARSLCRVVPASTFLAHFASDRSHMLRPDGDYQAPPPAEAPIRGSLASTAHNLREWIRPDAAEAPEHRGVVVPAARLLEEVRAR